jgi:multisubunit Na+/H+ antiporter MnhG subunit
MTETLSLIFSAVGIMIAAGGFLIALLAIFGMWRARDALEGAHGLALLCGAGGFLFIAGVAVMSLDPFVALRAALAIALLAALAPGAIYALAHGAMQKDAKRADTGEFES